MPPEFFGRLFFNLNLIKMEEVFIAFLDEEQGEGYGSKFRRENPDAFYRELNEFMEMYSFPQVMPR